MSASCAIVRFLGCSAALLLIAALAATRSSAQDKPAKSPVTARQTIRCAVIGGMMDTGLWPAVAKRFEEKTGHRVEVIVEGPKQTIAPVFEQGKADLLTMHASDCVINLVADGYGEDPQPWARNDLLLVGPATDPAGIRGMKDAVKALQKIVESKSKLLTHASLGTNEVLSDLLATGGIELDLQHVISLPSDRQREMLKRAAAANAYTLVGRIPFLNGKIPSHGMQIMVQGDARLRRPYVVIVAKAAKDDARHLAAQELAKFLRLPETQAWLSTFGRAALDDQPLFFPVALERP